MKQHLGVGIALALAGCAAPQSAVIPIPPPGPGMERIIGHSAAAATALLGPPSLDRSEAPGRMLQYARAGCVLDIYYYPDAKAGAPVARYAEARGRDGKPQDSGKCLSAMLGPV